MRTCVSCSYEQEEGGRCPKCGAENWYVDISGEAEIQVDIKLLGTDVRGPKEGKRRTHEKRVCRQHHRKLDCEVIVDRTVDRKNDYYREEVTIAGTGKVIHFCEEPLSEHYGHGDAKKKK